MVLQKKVYVRFELELKQEDSVTEVPCLVGSLKELGSWNKLKGIYAKKAKRDSIWKVDVKISPNSHFFFSWNLTKDGEKFCNDPVGLRPVTIGNSGGTVKTRYEDAGLQFVPKNRCRLYLRTTYHLGRDEILGIVGAGNQLGNWRNQDALLARNYGIQGHWEVMLDVERGTTVEFKWIVMEKISRKIRKWQDGDNRKITIGDDLKQYLGLAPWEGRIIKFTDILPDIKYTADEKIKSISPSVVSNAQTAVIVATTETDIVASDRPTPTPDTVASDTPTPDIAATITTDINTCIKKLENTDNKTVKVISPVNNKKGGVKDTSAFKQSTISCSNHGNSNHGTECHGYGRKLFKTIFDVTFNIYRQWTFNQ